MRPGRSALPVVLMLLTAGICSVVASAVGQSSTASKNTQPLATKQPSTEDQRAEGEKRFHNNCGRCHMAPQKFPPRVMAMVIRHMRVRATITDEDMRLILAYMTQ
jgi:mono/diheme cytochrome c family protein